MTTHLGLQRIMLPSAQVSTWTTGSITLPSARGAFSAYPAASYWTAILSGSSPTLNTFYTYQGGAHHTNGDYYMAGFMDVNGLDRRGWFIRTNNDGDLQSANSYTAPGGNVVVSGGSHNPPNKSNVDTSGNYYILASGVAAIGGISSTLAQVSNTGAILSQIGFQSANRSASSDYTYSQTYAVDYDNSKRYVGFGVPNSSGSGSSGLHGTVVKINSSNGIDWQKSVFDSSHSAGSRYAYTHCVQFDNNQNVVTLSYGSNSSSGLETEIMKFNSSGTLQWQRRWYGTASAGSRQDLFFNGVLTNDGSFFYATGNYRNASGGIDTWVTKIDASNGLPVWTRDLQQNTSQGSRYASPREVVIDSDQNVYICGFYGGNYESFIAKYNSSGTVQWIRKIDMSVSVVAQGLDIDQNGTLTFASYLAGGSNPMYLRVPNDGSKTGTYATGASVGGGSVIYTTIGTEVIDTTTSVNQTSGSYTVANGEVNIISGFLTATSFTPVISKAVIS